VAREPEESPPRSGFRTVTRAAVAVFLASALCAISPAPAARSRTIPNRAEQVAANADTNYSLTTSTCPVCTPEQIERWQFVVGNQSGIAGRDPVGWWISVFRASAPTADWFPQGVGKQTLCGTLADFGFYDGGGDEADWNSYIYPSQPFRFILDDVARRYGVTDEWHRRTVLIGDQASKELVVEGEITPDEGFYENSWFNKSSASSALEGHELCTYGPWVSDSGHDMRPEIHPSELYWWRTESSARLLTLQDDSNRFDRRGDFDLPSFDVPGWRPWSKFPRTGEFSVAVSLVGPPLFGPPPIGSPPRLEVTTEKLIKPALLDTTDADDGAEHGLDYNGQLLLKVVEGDATPSSAVDDDIRVDFNFCRAEKPLLPGFRDQLFGYVTLTTRVGDTDRGGPNGEGVHLVKVRRVDTGPTEAVFLETRPRILPLMVRRVGVAVHWVTSSVRRGLVNGRPALVADALVTLVPTGKTRVGDRVISRLEVAGAKGLSQPVLRRRGSRAFARIALPLTTPASIRLVTKSGSQLKVVPPEVGLTVPVIAEHPRSALSPADPGAVAAAVGAPGRVVPTAQRANAWRLTVSPQYAPRRNRTVSIDDESPIVEKLNDIILRHPRRRRALFGAPRLSVHWSFEARDAITGRPVKVLIDKPPRPDAIAVRGSDRSGRSTIEVTFPDTGAVYIFAASAAVRDRFGDRATEREVLSNAILAGTERAELVSRTLRIVAELAGIAPERLSAAFPLTNLPPAEPDPFDATARRVRGVGLLAYQAAADGRITLSELRRIREAAKALG
jgi:hypothetical protein